MTAIIIIISEFLFTVSILIWSLTRLITAITQFRIAATVSSAVAQTHPKATKRGWRNFDLFFAVVGMVIMASGMVYFGWFLSQPDGAVTAHQVAMLVLTAANMVIGNLLVQTITLKMLLWPNTALEPMRGAP